MKKAGPILLLVAIGMILFILFRPDPAAADFKTDMLDTVLQGMGQGDERQYIESQVGSNHSAAARACKGTAPEEAFKVYMREQFRFLISQSEKDGRKELSRTIQGLAHATMGPREFSKPANPGLPPDGRKYEAGAETELPAGSPNPPTDSAKEPQATTGQPEIAPEKPTPPDK